MRTARGVDSELVISMEAEQYVCGAKMFIGNQPNQMRKPSDKA